jgi:hypothetical protein
MIYLWIDIKIGKPDARPRCRQTGHSGQIIQPEDSMKLTRRYVFQSGIALLIFALGLLVYLPASAHAKAPSSQVVFHDAMRKLWEDHITWTRLYIISAAHGLPDQDLTAGRLLQNQDDIGNAIKPFYGEAAGAQLTALLRDHILIAAELIDAAKQGNNAAFADANTRWYANADAIAEFLHAANPTQWPLDEMKMMMKSHLDLTLKEASARLHGDYAADIAAYDEVHVEILQMADMLSDGIITQFPKSFK